MPTSKFEMERKNQLPQSKQLVGNIFFVSESDIIFNASFVGGLSIGIFLKFIMQFDKVTSIKNIKK